MSRHERLINRAIGVALTSEHKWRHGALLVHGNRILAHSVNKHRCDPYIDPNGATWHAEEMVLRRSLLLDHVVV